MATAQEYMDKAGAAARANDHAAAAHYARRAAGEHFNAGAHQPAVIAALCSVSSAIEAGHLDAAGEALDGIEQQLPGLRGIEDHVHDTLRTKRAQVRHLLEERSANDRPLPMDELTHLPPAATPDQPTRMSTFEADGRGNLTPATTKTPEEMTALLMSVMREPPLSATATQGLTPVDGTVDAPPTDPPAEQDEKPDSGLTPQDIRDRADGVGIPNLDIDDTGSVTFRDEYTPGEGEDADRAGRIALDLIDEALAPAGLATAHAAYGDGAIRGRIVPLPAAPPKNS